MRRLVIITIGLCLSFLVLACDGSAVPIPYLVDRNFELIDDCVTDFSAEEGTCYTISPDGEVSKGCERYEEQCVEHFYIMNRRGLPFFVHINAQYPCYPDWLIQRYSDPESEWYQHGQYRVVSLELANFVTDDVVHLIEILSQQDLQSTAMCRYRVEAGIEDLIRGEYGLKLWDNDQTLILETTFER